MPDRDVILQAGSGEPERKFEIQTRLGPLHIKLSAIRSVVSGLTLDLVRGTPKPSPPEESKIECEISLGEQLITLTESRAGVSAYILDLLREYPAIAAQQQQEGGHTAPFETGAP